MQDNVLSAFMSHPYAFDITSTTAPHIYMLDQTPFYRKLNGVYHLEQGEEGAINWGILLPD